MLGMERWCLADRPYDGGESSSIGELLDELAELRELDRRRQAHAPGSAAYDAATLEVDLRSRRLMDRFRDLQQRRERAPATRQVEDTRPVTQPLAERNGGSRAN